ncbi:hypothetical protein 19_00026 [Pseudomonas phage Epa19]|nr:hypothetical protein 19_00026 [Pseudomonas phage Epa19]
MGWVALVIAVIAIVVAYVMAPKPESRPPAGLSEFQLPTAEVGREIPVLFGTRIIEGPNVVWYGHLKAVPVKKKGGKK